MKHFKLFFMFAVLLMIGTTAYGQNVTISPKTGSLVGSLSESGETGFAAGLSCLWRHEQLPLTFTSSDEDDMTSTGEIAKPKASLGKRYYTENSVKVDSALIIVGGHRATYLTVSLPKGYRITGYKIVLVNDLNNYDLNPDKDLSGSGGSFNHVNQNTGYMRFYETTAWTTGSTGTNTYNNPEPQGCEIKAQAMNGNDGNIDTNGSDWGKEFTIQRTSLDETDMGNQLYFRLTKNYFYYGITIKSFEIRFTAEGTFAADVVPEAVGLARSVVASPFKTNKIDIGDLKVQAQEGTGATMFCYDYHNVRDLTAYNYIYQENTVHNGSDIDEELKGRPIEGDETKTIYPVSVDGNVLYAFGNNTYYAETPIQVHTPSGLEAPIGFRIVGARFNYLWGTATPSTTQTLTDHYYITATRNNQTYYLNDNLQFVRYTGNINNANAYAWAYDSETKNLYTSSGNIRYLSCTGNGDQRTLSFSTENGNWYNLVVFTVGNNTFVGWDSETASERFYLRYSSNGAIVERNTTSSTRANATTADSHTINLPGFTPGAYTLKVYDKEGDYAEDADGKPTKGMKAVVSSASDAGILELEDINNDAVKFEITGLEDGHQALVSVTLLLQALNPYIDNMNIVCHDPDNQLTLSKPFTANDFTVSGGKFVFYIPEEYQNTELTFTFSDLYSHYGDTTYPGGSNEHFGRYSFVTSDYFTPINGNGNDGLYTNQAYVSDGTAVEKKKLFTSVAGNIRFKFNNAEDLSNTGSGEGYLEDYPFSVKSYLGSADPDGTTKTGAFIDCKLNASATKSGIYYLFTADETRYNIAPTKAWQHRSYAFYRMDIELQAKTYTPDLVWEKIYDTDKTYYDNGKTNSQWGLKLRTTDEGEVVKGYLSVKEILDAIDARTADDSAAPVGKDQILYIDGSELYSIINSSIKEGESTTTLDLSDLKQGLGKNAIVFLPENTTSTLDNYAYKTSSGSFMAGKNFVLTDKQPFYSPYEIQVDAANIAKYERLVTNGKNGKVTAASIILPFQILVDDEGAHTNADGTKAFSLHQMQEESCLSDEAPEGINLRILPQSRSCKNNRA